MPGYLRKTLYIDPDLLINAKMKMVSDRVKGIKNYRSFTELVTDMWTVFFNSNISLKGYSNIKGERIKTTEMKKTTVVLSESIDKKINKFLSGFSDNDSKEKDMNFSLITNELIQRIYLFQEL